jgi:hypothetical protein
MFWREHKLSATSSQPFPNINANILNVSSLLFSSQSNASLPSPPNDRKKPRCPTPPAYRKHPATLSFAHHQNTHSSIASPTNLIQTSYNLQLQLIEVPKHFTYSTMSSDGPLFSSDLISPEVLKALPEGYSCRPLERKDYHNGFLDVLRVLTTVGDITEDVRLFPHPLFLSHPLSLPSCPYPKPQPLMPLLPAPIQSLTPTAMERALHLDVHTQRLLLPALHHRLVAIHRRHRRAHRRAQVHPPIGACGPY